MSSPSLRAATFLTAAHRLDQCPDDSGVEVAFAGRSNAGKSSALNVLVGQRSLARTSKTPGRTQQLVFFALEDGGALRLADLPGYGFAEVPLKLRQHWDRVLGGYLCQRQSLRGVVLIADIRRGLTDLDRGLIHLLTECRRPLHVLLTKADKLGSGAARSALAKVRSELAREAPGATAQLFSALKREGVEEASAVIAGWLAEGIPPTIAAG